MSTVTKSFRVKGVFRNADIPKSRVRRKHWRGMAFDIYAVDRSDVFVKLGRRLAALGLTYERPPVLMRRYL